MTQAERRRAVTFVDRHPKLADFREEALLGLTSQPKRVSPKFFYDRRGSELFERITGLDEYYPTRAEIEILERRAAEIAACLGPDTLLVEYGSGASRKVRALIEALGAGTRYLAIDISKDFLAESAETLAEDYPGLEVFALCADYTGPFELPSGALEGVSDVAVFFPGSTIGNFSPREAIDFLRLTARQTGAGGTLIVGADLKKDKRTLESAYDDREGVTAEFNLNLLDRMNRELGADFRRDRFRHRAIYNEREGRVEMHLESQERHQVKLGGRAIQFERGETIHTENSYKFTIGEFQQMGREAGFEPRRVWTDGAGLFSVHLMRAALA